MLFAVLATGCLAAAVATGSPGRAAVLAEATGVRPTTSVLSARRVPEMLSDMVATWRLRTSLDAAMTDPALRSARDRSCLVVQDDGEVVYARQADQALIPASNMKILTGMAAISRLGVGARYVTEVRTASRVRDGIVDGPVYLVGSGDPLLATADYAATFQNQPQVYTPFESLADAMVKAGVRQVRGGVIGDESRYDTVRYVPTWKPNYITDHETGPASALLVNDGFIQYAPLPRRASSEPAAHAAAVLIRLLEARGVVVGGEPASGVAPAQADALASIASPPMAEVVGQMIRESDNLTAELLVKELGHKFAGSGSWDGGLEVVRAALAERGLPVEGIVAADGSGLSRSDRLSCALLMQAMEVLGPDSAVAKGFPVAGQTGTLARRFAGNPAAGRLWAKTGSLDGVASLTGYARVADDGVVAFSLVVNELPRDSMGRELQERIGAALVSYPDAPPPAALAPLPLLES